MSSVRYMLSSLYLEGIIRTLYIEYLVFEGYCLSMLIRFEGLRFSLPKAGRAYLGYWHLSVQIPFQ